MCKEYYIRWPDCSYTAWSDVRPCPAAPVDDPYAVSPKHDIRQIRIRVQHTLVWESADDDEDEEPGRLCFPDGELVDMSDTRCRDCRTPFSGRRRSSVRVEVEKDDSESGKGNKKKLGCFRALRA